MSIKHPNPADAYPALMTYIADRNTQQAANQWCNQLRTDKSDAETGAFSDVAADMRRAQADYARAARALGQDTFPYNRSMGVFLGLDIQTGNGEPEHGYYMANTVTDHHTLGIAAREAQQLINEGQPLRIVTARTKADRTPCRFLTFTGPDQIKIVGNNVEASNGKKRVRLGSGWSVESCLQKLVAALQSGHAYGESI